MKFLKNLSPVVAFGLIFGVVVWQIEPPGSFINISIPQAGLFFIPLFLLFASIINLYFQFWPRSLIVSLGFILLLTLKALGTLNLISLGFTITATILIAKSFKKPAANLKKFTYNPKVPKLSKLHQQ